MENLINWRDSFSVRNDLIDSQHKKLVDIINQFHAFYKEGASDEKLKTIIIELNSYTDYHFKTEEGILQAANYPNLTAHKIAHAKLMEKLEQIHKDFVGGKKNFNFEMMHFLKDWLINHILDEDKKYVGLI
jgi:hemerythrin-like metal-binding protein